MQLRYDTKKATQSHARNGILNDCPSLLGQLCRRHGIDAKLLSDMGDCFWIGEAAVGHHCAQLDKPRLGKEQSRQMLARV